MIHIQVGAEQFDAGGALSRLEAEGAGAIASFVGIVRGDDGLTTLTLDHYPAMTERVLRGLAEDAVARWNLLGVTIIHRVGTMSPGQRIVFVGTCAAHRGAALESCAFLIDALKTRAPFWKREGFPGGQSRWVEAKDADDRAAARWD
jgi:molybdopterin synthase catalytic subunit